MVPHSLRSVPVGVHERINSSSGANRQTDEDRAEGRRAGDGGSDELIGRASVNRCLLQMWPGMSDMR